MPIQQQSIPLETLVLDELADGQWHPLFKIKRKLDQNEAVTKKTSKEEILVVLQDLKAQGYLLEGANDSFRFESSRLKTWRITSETLDRTNKQYEPRFFGGILEDDGWALAELKTYDLIHFRVEGDTNKQDIMNLTGEKASSIQIDEDGLYRVFTTPGSETYETIKNTKTTHPELKISGVRLEKNLKRRDMDDLPPRFVAQLCQYYGSFAKVLLRSNMSSINKHLPDPDDAQQQIYIWVIDAIQRYDASTSIPFGAYLGTSLKKWVHNLNRRANGRSIADIELKHTRAITEFKAAHGRDPRPEELAELLDTDVSTVKKDSMAINTVLNLRNMGTINHEDGEVPLPSHSMVNDNIDALLDNMFLSAAITTAANEIGDKEGLRGLLAVFHEMWGDEVRSKKTAAWLRNPKTGSAKEAVLKRAGEILRSKE